LRRKGEGRVEGRVSVKDRMSGEDTDSHRATVSGKEGKGGCRVSYDIAVQKRNSIRSRLGTSRADKGVPSLQVLLENSALVIIISEDRNYAKETPRGPAPENMQ